MMTLYWAPRTRSLRALCVLEESGAPYERVRLDLSAGEQKSAEFRAINPMEELASTHDVDSIIDAFLAVAIHVARQNDLAAVALPGGDSHLLSNVNALENALFKRLSSPAGGHYSSLSPTARMGIVSPPAATVRIRARS